MGFLDNLTTVFGSVNKKNTGSGLQIGGERVFTTSTTSTTSQDFSDNRVFEFIINSPNSSANATSKKDISLTPSVTTAVPIDKPINLTGVGSSGSNGGAGTTPQILLYGAVGVGALLIISSFFKK